MAAVERLKPVGFSDLPGWQEDRHNEALAAFQRSCAETLKKGHGFPRGPVAAGKREDWLEVCKAALDLGNNVSAASARAFFESRFQPVSVISPKDEKSMITGYFEPEMAGSLKPDPTYHVPVLARPADLVQFNQQQKQKTGLAYGRVVSGKPQAYLTRKEIEQGALDGKTEVLAWLSSWADLFFMHIQGSGRVRLPDGTGLRLAYAAKSGLPYTPIGRLLIEWGEVAREDMSMQAIRAWMVANPTRARELMWHNKSYIFFRKLELENPELGPVGGQQIQLTPLRSLAVDRRYWVYGTPLWMDTNVPVLKGSSLQPYRKLMVAQDTGSAIRGWVRGDIFFGSGDDAGKLAGRMQSPARMFALLPHQVISRLGLKKASTSAKPANKAKAER